MGFPEKITDCANTSFLSAVVLFKLSTANVKPSITNVKKVSITKVVKLTIKIAKPRITAENFFFEIFDFYLKHHHKIRFLAKFQNIYTIFGKDIAKSLKMIIFGISGYDVITKWL